MILTTTPSVEGRSIEEYRGIVFGEVISGVDVIKTYRRPEQLLRRPLRHL